MKLHIVPHSTVSSRIKKPIYLTLFVVVMLDLFILRLQIAKLDPFKNKQPAEMRVFYC